jgi:zinc transporter 9
MGLVLLLCFSLSMGLVSFAAGSLPLSFTLSDYFVDAISTCGIGILISSALAIIIPEGMQTAYSNIIDHTDVDQVAEIPSAHISGHTGLALLAGYGLMFLIDQLTSLHKHESSHYIAVDSLSEMHSYRNVEAHLHPSTSGQVQTTSAGLAIHSLADGIALGASAHASKTVSIVVFFAMICHKLPAAFGLCAVLMKSKLSKRTIRIHLVIFSLAAPLGAILTSLIITMFARADHAASIAYLTGIVLVFSGGTFLFVAISHAPRHADLKEIFLLVLGMAIPPVLGSLIRHEH